MYSFYKLIVLYPGQLSLFLTLIISVSGLNVKQQLTSTGTNIISVISIDNTFN